MNNRTSRPPSVAAPSEAASPAPGAAVIGAVAEIGDSVDASEEFSDELLDPPPHAIARKRIPKITRRSLQLMVPFLTPPNKMEPSANKGVACN